MANSFEPFTPEVFQNETGINAYENEAVYIRWVNSKINYETFLLMKEMTTSLKEIVELLKENAQPPVSNFPFSK